MEIAIEAKASAKISGRHLKGLRSLKQDHPNIKRRVVVCCDDIDRTTEDGIEILPAILFTEMLWQGNLFS
jgi:hypothetical protein